MPNWCYNWLEIDGPAEDVKAFVDGIDMEKGFIETYYPTPAELLDNDLPVINHFTDIREGVSDEERARRKALIEKYGSTDWYNWRISHWGTKWGDCELNIQNGNCLRFDTAWSPPIEAIEYIAELFPTLVFTLEYEETGMCFEGKAVITAHSSENNSWDTQWNEETQEMERVE